MAEFTADGHTVVVVVGNDSVHLEGHCPGPGYCQATFRCWHCEGAGTITNGPIEGKAEADPDRYIEETCESCEGSGAIARDQSGDCFIMQWFKAERPEEYYVGGDASPFRFPASIEWKPGGWEDGPEWRFTNAVAP